MRTSIAIAAALVAGLFFTACKDKHSDEEAEFKKEEIMANLADNYIVPGYADLQMKINALASDWNAFTTDLSPASLDEVKLSWQAANTSFQKVSMFEVGPAMSVNFHMALGTFPADSLRIQNNIGAGSYDLSAVANADAIGFDALDYLFYGSDAFNKLTTSAARRAYVSAVIAKMKAETDQVVSGWAGYRATWVAGTGTSSTSPFAQFINAFCKNYELAKAAKVGIPIGTTTLGIQQPHYLEARRSGFGKQLLKANLQALHRIYLGNAYSNGASGKGFDDYLIALERSSLSADIDTRFTYMETQPDTWTGSIEQMMSTAPQVLNAYYSYLQASTVNMKTDMSSAFGVLITYQDNDGD